MKKLLLFFIVVFLVVVSIALSFAFYMKYTFLPPTERDLMNAYAMLEEVNSLLKRQQEMGNQFPKDFIELEFFLKNNDFRWTPPHPIGFTVYENGVYLLSWQFKNRSYLDYYSQEHEGIASGWYFLPNDWSSERIGLLFKRNNSAPNIENIGEIKKYLKQ